MTKLTRLSRISEYLWENEKFRKHFFAYSYGAQVRFFDKKKCRKSRDTVPLTEKWLHFISYSHFHKYFKFVNKLFITFVWTCWHCPVGWKPPKIKYCKNILIFCNFFYENCNPLFPKYLKPNLKICYGRRKRLQLL